MIKFLLGVAIILALVSCTQTRNTEVANVSSVPTQVQASLLSKFPDAENVTWQKKGDRYEASFNSGGIKSQARIRDDGKFIMEYY